VRMKVLGIKVALRKKLSKKERGGCRATRVVSPTGNIEDGEKRKHHCEKSIGGESQAKSDNEKKRRETTTMIAVSSRSGKRVVWGQILSKDKKERGSSATEERRPEASESSRFVWEIKGKRRPNKKRGGTRQERKGSQLGKS